MGNVHMKDIIGNDCVYWEPGDKIILNGGTGSGKSTFTLEDLPVLAGIIQERILYLVNRTNLKKQIEEKAKEIYEANRQYVDIISYQKMEEIFSEDPEEGRRILDQHGYIVADECHYFWTDATQNNYTDLLYDALLEWKHGVTIYCSATAEPFFDWLIETGKVKKEHVYYIPADYSYVEGVTFYEKKQLQPLIDQIIKNEEETKIVVFVSSGDRMKEMHEIYGNSASYVCSQSTQDRWMRKNCDRNCIQNETFEKRILFATSALDNGVNLKDRRIRHMFTELYDIDSIRQSLGRKRSITDDGIDETDTCRFYIKIQAEWEVKRRITWLENQLAIVRQYREDYDQFVKDYRGDRNFIQKNPIFYPDVITGYHINQMRELKAALDLKSYRSIRDIGLVDYVMKYLSEQLADKYEISTIASAGETDKLISYLKEIEGKRLYSEDQEKLKEQFREDMAIHNGKSKRCGMKDMNTWIARNYGDKYQKHFINKNPETNRPLRDRRRVLEDGTTNPHRNDGYWLLC